MKISQLHPCDACGGNPTPSFYVVEYSQAIVTPAAGRELQQRRGLTQFFGGAAGLADIFVPESDDAILVFGDKEPALRTQLLICQACFMSGPLDLLALSEKRRSREHVDQAEAAS